MLLLISVRAMNRNDHLFGKELLIRFIMHAFHELLSICVCASLPFGFEGGIYLYKFLIIAHLFYFQIPDIFFH